MSKRILLAGIVVTALVMGSSIASAGAKNYDRVYMTSTSFSGSFADIHHSNSATEYLGCAEYPGYIYCSSRSASGSYRSCTSSSTTLRRQVRAMSDSDYVVVRFAGGLCTSLMVRKGSLNGIK